MDTTVLTHCLIVILVTLLDTIQECTGDGYESIAIKSPGTQHGIAETLQVDVTSSSGRNLTLNLRRNNRVRLNVPVYFLGEAGGPINHSSTEQPAFYQDPKTGSVFTVKQRTDDQDKKLYVQDGVFKDGNNKYEISLKKTSNRKNAAIFNLSNKKDAGSFDYKITRMKPVKESTRGNEDVIDEVKLPRKSKLYREKFSGAESSGVYESMMKTRRKRAVADFDDLHVELVFVVDSSEWLYFLDRASGDEHEALTLLKEYFAFQMNGMDLVYRSIDSRQMGFSITLWLKSIIIAKSAEESPWITDNMVTTSPVTVSASPTLDSFGEWRASKSGWGWSNPDHAMLWTRYNLIGESVIMDGNVGYSWVCGICENQLGTSIIEDIGYQGFLVAAHELGHNLGAMHDGDTNNCRSEDKYLMASTKASISSLDEGMLDNPYTFSSCSVRDIGNCLSGSKTGYPRVCLSNVVCAHEETLPETVSFSLAQQCIDFLGTGATFCPHLYERGYEGLVYGDVCTVLWCARAGETRCRSNSGLAAAEWSDCSPSGDGSKVCAKGKCVTTPDGSPQNICAPSVLSMYVPQSCSQHDETLYLGDTSISCSALVDSNPSYYCNAQTLVKQRCCQFCQMHGVFITPVVCPEDYGVSFRVNGARLTCDDIVQQFPGFCFTEPVDVAPYCCAACHRAGLVYPRLDTFTKRPPTIPITTPATIQTTTQHVTPASTTTTSTTTTTTTTTTTPVTTTTITTTPSTTTTTKKTTPRSTTPSKPPVKNTSQPKSESTTIVAKRSNQTPPSSVTEVMSGASRITSLQAFSILFMLQVGLLVVHL